MAVSCSSWNLRARQNADELSHQEAILHRQVWVPLQEQPAGPGLVLHVQLVLAELVQDVRLHCVCGLPEGAADMPALLPLRGPLSSKATVVL